MHSTNRLEAAREVVVLAVSSGLERRGLYLVVQTRSETNHAPERVAARRTATADLRPQLGPNRAEDDLLSRSPTLISLSTPPLLLPPEALPCTRPQLQLGRS